MKIIRTDTAKPEDLSTWEQEQVYNGLDCCLTSEILDVLLPQLDNQTASTYAFERELQAPVLEMRLRGVLVDSARKSEVIDELFTKMDQVERNLERIVLEGVGMAAFNWRSYDHLKELFYERLKIPEVRRQGRPTVNREALEKIGTYTLAEPIVLQLEALRDIFAKIKMLRTEIDPDGRMRTSYNIAGTSTGRFSSSYSEYGTGGNLQNIEESLRSVFISDPGTKFAKFDAKSGESFCVGAIEWNLFDDRYLRACESGDPHTATARICWPKLAWTGVLYQDKEVAEQPCYRHYSYRFMCKKLGHGSNYGGKAQTLSTQTRLPIEVVSGFQPQYFRAFPAHLQWHAWVDRTIRREGKLTSLTGRRRHFWGRRNDDSTLREAIAYDPQGSLADIVNTAMLNIWRRKTATLIMQDHDALTFQYPEHLEDEIVPQLIKQLEVPIELKNGRRLLIPYDAKTGWNRGEFNAKTNPDGLKDYTPGDRRKRSPKVRVLDRPVHRAYG